MKSHIIFILSAFHCISTFPQESKTDTLNKVVININSESFIDIKTTFSKETNIFPFENVNEPVYGLTLDGEGILRNDAGLIRVVLIDNNNNAHLVFEASLVYSGERNFNIHSAGIETSLLDSIVPKSIEIILRDAEIKINRIRTFKIDENTKQHFKEYKEIMI